MAYGYDLPKDLNRSMGDGIKITQNKNFYNGIRNAVNILDGLEKSFQKTSKYENKLMRCKASHDHTHSFDEWWQNEPSDEKYLQLPNQDQERSSRSQVDLIGSWSTMSIVCMQYQYEELSKRYEALLQAYDGKCRGINDRDKKISRLRRRFYSIYSQLIIAHKSLLSIGVKYLSLRRKRMIQKQYYQERLGSVDRFVQEIAPELQQDCVNGDNKCKYEVSAALLMSEIRKCNKLITENLYLKTQIIEATPATSESF